MKAAGLEQEEGSFNRTGIMTHPELSAELIEGTKQNVPKSADKGPNIASVRATYVEEALRIGSRPAVIMDDMAEMEKTGATRSAELPAQENGLAVLLDKLGERLAFERQGARLYEACVQKCELLGEQEGGPALKDLQHIYEEELEHFKMLQKLITDMGGDATVQTPSADVAGVLSQGVLQVVTDSRTTMTQTLQAMLVAELADNDGWEMLGDLASTIGHSDLEEQCHRALEQEQEHLENVREWLAAMTTNEASMAEHVAVDDDDEDDRDDASGREQRREEKSRTAKNKTQRKSEKGSQSRKRKGKAKK